jgi:hypothetical protein
MYTKIHLQENFLFSNSSRPVVVPSHASIQRFPGVERPKREAEHPLPTSVEEKECVDMYVCLHGAVLN